MNELNGLNPELCKQLIKEILSYKNVEKIVIYGSRATNQFRKTSDIDVAIFAKDWTSRDINITKDKLEENIKTPLKFDLVNYYNIKKESLKESIIKGKILYESK